MAGLEVSSSMLFSKSNLPSLCCRRGIRTGYPIARQTKNSSDRQVIAKLYAIMEAVADRVEMHNNVGDQRDNWNRLLSTSINTMTLAGATMAGLAATIAAEGAPFTALKLSSIVLYVAAMGLLLVMNKIQPSQLAEEKRNASRLFKQLYFQIQTMLSLGKPDISDVNEAMGKVLALDKAYPLPLMGSMLEKFPSEVEPARWWPKQRQKQVFFGENMEGNNGWNRKLEEEMKQIVKILKKKDLAEYIDLCTKALKLNKMLATSGPLLTLLGVLGSSCMSTTHCSWPVMIGVIAGAMASVVNTVEIY
ncbi:probable F-box protein At4g22030 [Hibiscus syriacus]|uniref:probable F-box protein At4g22030 n=1 Tax=Hibiscus syriacus TaxID=106335 RepID=UPI001920CE14|nr:probable F-box protein At4g22030 [Hibiscus syriacus]